MSSAIKLTRKTSQDIFSSLKYFNFMARFFLTAPYRVEGKVDERKFVPFKNTNALYILVCLMSISIEYYMVYSYFQWAVMLRLCQAIFNAFAMTIIILFTFIKKSQAVHIMKKFTNKEKFLAQYGIKCNYKKLRIVSIIEIVVIIIIMCSTLYFVTKEYSQSRQITLTLCYIVPNGLIMTYLCQYINYTLILHDWLKNLNAYLLKLCNDDNDIEAKLITGRKSYIIIWKLSKLLQSYYEIPVLFVKATSFLNTTAFLYLGLASENIFFSTYMWIGANILKIFALPFFCDFCVEKVKSRKYYHTVNRSFI